MMLQSKIFNSLAAVVLWTLFSLVAVVAAEPVRIVAFGDSLTAGYRLKAAEAFPAQLEKALRSKGHDVVITNAGVSGDTATAGLARLDWSVPDGTDAVILELGANDALRGVDPIKTYEALARIVASLKQRGIQILIAGMKAPRNMGAEYVQTFDRIYPYLADHHKVLLYPFFLDGVAGKRNLNQQDGLHPTAEGIALIVDRILPFTEGLIKLAKATRG